jgi:hypothetical protein
VEPARKARRARAETTCWSTGAPDTFSTSALPVSPLVDPLLRELEACAAAAGVKNPQAAVSLRWNGVGNPVAVHVETPGYEDLPCAGDVFARLTQIHRGGEGSVRCELVRAEPVDRALYGDLLSPGAAPPPPISPNTWYGWQTLIFDALPSR